MTAELLMVEARFNEEGEMIPLAFFRSGRKFVIQSIGRISLADDVRRFLVTAENRVYEIGYDLEGKVWRLYRTPEELQPPRGGRGIV